MKMAEKRKGQLDVRMGLNEKVEERWMKWRHSLKTENQAFQASGFVCVCVHLCGWLWHFQIYFGIRLRCSALPQNCFAKVPVLKRTHDSFHIVFRCAYKLFSL